MGLCKRFFPWAQVQSLTENVQSMDAKDCPGSLTLMRSAFAIAHGSAEVQEQEGVEVYLGSSGKLPLQGQVRLFGQVEEKAFLEKRWARSIKALPTFTTSRPSPQGCKGTLGTRSSQVSTIPISFYSLVEGRSGEPTDSQCKGASSDAWLCSQLHNAVPENGSSWDARTRRLPPQSFGERLECWSHCMGSGAIFWSC